MSVQFFGGQGHLLWGLGIIEKGLVEKKLWIPSGIGCCRKLKNRDHWK